MNTKNSNDRDINEEDLDQAVKDGRLSDFKALVKANWFKSRKTARRAQRLAQCATYAFKNQQNSIVKHMVHDMDLYWLDYPCNYKAIETTGRQADPYAAYQTVDVDNRDNMNPVNFMLLCIDQKYELGVKTLASEAINGELPSRSTRFDTLVSKTIKRLLNNNGEQYEVGEWVEFYLKNLPDQCRDRILANPYIDSNYDYSSKNKKCLNKLAEFSSNEGQLGRILSCAIARYDIAWVKDIIARGAKPTDALRTLVAKERKKYTPSLLQNFLTILNKIDVDEQMNTINDAVVLNLTYQDSNITYFKHMIEIFDLTVENRCARAMQYAYEYAKNVGRPPKTPRTNNDLTAKYQYLKDSGANPSRIAANYI